MVFPQTHYYLRSVNFKFAKEQTYFYLEAYSRSENFRFNNIGEGSSDEPEDVEETLRDFLEPEPFSSKPILYISFAQIGIISYAIILWVKVVRSVFATTAKEIDLTIGSINARGLGDRIKRREFFNWLRKKQMAMYFIQEAHCTENNMHDSGLSLADMSRARWPMAPNFALGRLANRTIFIQIICWAP